MNTDKLKELLERLPLGLLLVLYGAYLGYGYYTFNSEPESPFLQKRVELEQVHKENAALQLKIKQANEFFKQLDAKKSELRGLAQSLDDLKGTLNSEIDLPIFMKTVVTEAKRVGLTVLGIRPIAAVSHEYYHEQPFQLGFRGAYVQLLVFLDHLSNIQNIVRADTFLIKPASANTQRFVELEGTIEIKTYKYVGTKADSIGRDKAATPAPASAPNAAAGAQPARGGR